MSPDDYRRAAGFRRSSAAGVTIPHASWAYQDNPLSEGFVFEDTRDPRLAEFMGAGRQTTAGIGVGQHVAMRNSTFFRATNLIASSVGMLPTTLMRRLPNGDTEEAIDHPLRRVLKLKPNGYQTPLEFKTQMQTNVLLDGNAYARIARGVGGKVVGLIPMKRGSCQPLLNDAGELTFRYNAPGGQQMLSARDVFHFRSMITLDGLRGISLLDVAAQAIGVAVQAERAAGRLFGQGVMAGGALEVPTALSDTAYERLRESLEERYASAENAGKWMILEEGTKASQLGGDAKDTQHLETRARQAEEISRFTGVPRPLLMFDETSWGSGVEMLGQFFVTYCLLAWFVAWEQAIERTLDDKDLGVLYVKFNDGALLRGSLKDQADFFSKALGNQNPWMTQNEVRKMFDQNRMDGADVLPAGAKAIPAPAPADPKGPTK
ncbi:phage portal protein [uncultured Sphingomonas sp.]|uniref:phage portal protein n=1 Tax=uncultured Sphingomonas sp. TaxID=158754 RepID=UPI0025969992|nr:phage portal protein [uncultured Sphingomonas sp.]